MLRGELIPKDEATFRYVVAKYKLDAIFDSLDIREDTRADYKYRIKHFLEFFKVRSVDADVLLEYKQALRSDDSMSVSTKNKYLTCARIFLRELYRLGYIHRDVTVNVKSFQQNKKHKVFGLDEHEVSLICGWMNRNPSKLREHAILCLLLFQGLRQFEICNIKRSDVDLENCTVAIRGKGMDDKDIVHLHPQTVRVLKRHMEESRPRLEHLFISKSKLSNDFKLTPRGLRHIVKSIFEELGIERNVHGCRHYFTTRLIKKMDGGLLQVAQFTRHKSVETLQIYNDSIIEKENIIRYHDAFADISDKLVLQQA